VTSRRVRVPVWALLNLPFGVTSGFVSVMLGFILKKQGMGEAVIATLVASNLLPHTWKVIWAPIADSTLTRKKWYVLGNVASCATILALAFVPITTGNISLIKWMVFVNAVAITFVGMSVEGLMAHATPPEERGRAAGWFQMGNLGGAGLGGGFGLWLAGEVNSQVSLIVIACRLALCTIGLLFVPEAEKVPEDPEAAAEAKPHWFARIIEVFKELFRMLLTRRGAVAIALVFLPIGSAAAQGIFSGQIATDWRASGSLVALTSGVLAGLISAVGCLVGGFMSDRLGRRNAYMLSGLICAAAAIGFALAPKAPVTFAIFSLAYQFAGGIAYGAFTGFVLEVIGKGAAATKYNALASLSNIPITYMTKVDGWVSTNHGPVKMLFADAASEIAGIVIFLLIVAIIRPDKERLPDEPTLPEAKVVS